MASITTWVRLEPQVRTDDLTRPLQAQVHDPLWLLTRQWQFGEFLASDGGSPVDCRMEASMGRVELYRAGEGGDTLHRYHHRGPLEALLEREPPTWAGDPRLAAEAGLHFLRLLDASGAGHLRDTYRAAYPLRMPDDADGLDRASRRFLSVMAERAPDGAALLADLRPAVQPDDGEPALPERPAIPSGDREQVLQAATRWLAWFADVFGEESDGDRPPGWVSERMEHTGGAAVTDPESEGAELFSIGITEHRGGRLEWDAFDARSAMRVEAGGVFNPRVSEHRALPTAVRFPGMPLPRWWELEDGGVNLAAVQTARDDLARMLLLEFVLVYGNDWLLAPLELPVGHAGRVRSLVVTDTFGVRVRVQPAADLDPGWQMFTLGGNESEERLLMLPPSAPDGLGGPPLEEVLFGRDEAANLAWGIEQVVQSATGRPLERSGATPEERSGRAEEDGSRDRVAQHRYRLATDVPPSWVPLVPTHADDDSVRLQRGAQLAHEDIEPVHPRGRVLEPGRELSLFDEEVPRAGLRVRRAYRCVRWTDGSTHLWLARSAGPGRGEASSGLRFDILE